MVRIQDIDKQLEKMPVKDKRKMKLGYKIMKYFNNIENYLKRDAPPGNGYELMEIKKFDDRINNFWREVSKHYNFIVERNLKYLDWRYCNPRSGNFIIKQAEDNNGNILGYSVIMINRYLENYPIGFIVDLLTLPERLDVAQTLIREINRHFDSQNVNIINCILIKGNPYEEILKKNGFLDSRVKFYLLHNLHRTDMEELITKSSPHEIHFMYGDIDSFPVEIPQYKG
jgi:hypothetical protein